jgi:drug/metabolite transporter (DMT)-like permease
VAVATVAALVAAALFAAATALQHRSAGLVALPRASSEQVAPTAEVAGSAGERAGALPWRVALRFFYDSARHPLWIAGAAAEVAGLGLHALALREGPLTLVQPLLVSSVIFALPLRQLIERRRPGRRDLVSAAALGAGLALFLVAATPANGTSRPADGIPTLVALVVVPVSMAAAALVARRVSAERAAAALGVGAGVGFAAAAGLIKTVTGELASGGIAAAVGNWPLWALAVVGGAGIVLSQLAYRAAPLRASLGAITAVDPLVSVVIGVAVFDEQFRRSLPAVSLELVGIVIAAVGLLQLTRREPAGPSAPSFPGDLSG